MTKLTKTEHRVLAAMRLTDRVHAADVERDVESGYVTPGQLAHPDRCLQGFRSILGSVEIVSLGRRRSSERQVYDALQKLVARGLTWSDLTSGMGGGFTLYMRLEESQQTPTNERSS